MRRRLADLDEISAQPDTLTVNFAELGSAAACGGVYSLCTGDTMPWERWNRFNGLNIQVDLGQPTDSIG